VRKALEAAPRNIPLLGEAESERKPRKPLDALSRLVLHPLLKHVNASRSWIICPDGNLWLVPWETLTLPDGTYAIEPAQGEWCRPSLLLGRLHADGRGYRLASYEQVTVVVMPPRGVKAPTTRQRRGWQAATKSSSKRLTTVS
jgi:hypothetical protein